MKKPSNGKDSKNKSACPKGKRKLEYNDNNQPKLPLTGKLIYLDVKDARLTKKLETDLKRLGSSVEKFFVKEINYLITSHPRPKQKNEDRLQSADSPAGVSTPSPFNCGPSPSPGAVETKAPQSVTRGKAILQKAQLQKKTSSIIENAEKWKVKIVSVEAALKWILKELAKLPPDRSKSNQSANTRGCKIKRLRSPMLKFESNTHQYRPVHGSLDSWPFANVDTPRGTCPFDGTTVGRGERSREERGDRIGLAQQIGNNMPASPACIGGEDSESNKTPKVEAPGKTRPSENQGGGLSGMKVVTAGELRRRKEQKKIQERKKGYCECCQIKYDDLDKHVFQDQHRSFIRDKKNYETLDNLILTGPSTARFLQRVLLRHCSKKRDTDHISGSDEEVMLITPGKSTAKAVVRNKKQLKPKSPSKGRQPDVMMDCSIQGLNERRELRRNPGDSKPLSERLTPSGSKKPLNDNSGKVNIKEKVSGDTNYPVEKKESVLQKDSKSKVESPKVSFDSPKDSGQMTSATSKKKTDCSPEKQSCTSEGLDIKNHVVPVRMRNSLGVYPNMSPSRVSWARRQSLSADEDSLIGADKPACVRVLNSPSKAKEDTAEKNQSFKNQRSKQNKLLDCVNKVDSPLPGDRIRVLRETRTRSKQSSLCSLPPESSPNLQERVCEKLEEATKDKYDEVDGDSSSGPLPRKSSSHVESQNISLSPHNRSSVKSSEIQFSPRRQRLCRSQVKTVEEVESVNKDSISYNQDQVDSSQVKPSATCRTRNRSPVRNTNSQSEIELVSSQINNSFLTSTRSHSPIKDSKLRNTTKLDPTTNRSLSPVKDSKFQSKTKFDSTTTRSQSPVKDSKFRSKTKLDSTTTRSPSPVKDSKFQSKTKFESTTTRSHSPVKDSKLRNKNKLDSTTTRSQSPAKDSNSHMKDNLQPSQGKDSVRTKLDSSRVKDSIRTKLDSSQGKDSIRTKLDSSRVKDSIRTKLDSSQGKDSVRTKLDSSQGKDSIRTKLDSSQVKDSVTTRSQSPINVRCRDEAEIDPNQSGEPTTPKIRNRTHGNESRDLTTSRTRNQSPVKDRSPDPNFCVKVKCDTTSRGMSADSIMSRLRSPDKSIGKNDDDRSVQLLNSPRTRRRIGSQDEEKDHENVLKSKDGNYSLERSAKNHSRSEKNVNKMEKSVDSEPVSPRKRLRSRESISAKDSLKQDRTHDIDVSQDVRNSQEKINSVKIVKKQDISSKGNSKCENRKASHIENKDRKSEVIKSSTNVTSEARKSAISDPVVSSALMTDSMKEGFYINCMEMVKKRSQMRQAAQKFSEGSRLSSGSIAASRLDGMPRKKITVKVSPVKSDKSASNDGHQRPKSLATTPSAISTSGRKKDANLVRIFSGKSTQVSVKNEDELSSRSSASSKSHTDARQHHRILHKSRELDNMERSPSPLFNRSPKYNKNRKTNDKHHRKSSNSKRKSVVCDPYDIRNLSPLKSGGNVISSPRSGYSGETSRLKKKNRNWRPHQKHSFEGKLSSSKKLQKLKLPDPTMENRVVTQKSDVIDPNLTSEKNLNDENTRENASVDKQEISIGKSQYSSSRRHSARQKLELDKCETVSSVVSVDTQPLDKSHGPTDDGENRFIAIKKLELSDLTSTKQEDGKAFPHKEKRSCGYKHVEKKMAGKSPKHRKRKNSHQRDSGVGLSKEKQNKGHEKTSDGSTLKWETATVQLSPKAKTVKLNKSWTLLSDRSMAKILHSEEDELPFEGFQPEHAVGGTLLGSEMSYVETTEVELEGNSDHEWLLEHDEGVEEDSPNKNEFIDYVNCTFTSPGKRTDSSWDETLDNYIDTQLNRSKPSGANVSTNFSDVHSSPRIFNSPRQRRHQQRALTPNKRKAEFSDLPPELLGFNCTPKRRKLNKLSTGGGAEVSSVECVDEDIEFNYCSPQKLKDVYSPKRMPGNEIIISSSPLNCRDGVFTSTPHSSRQNKKAARYRSLDLTALTGGDNTVKTKSGNDRNKTKKTSFTQENVDKHSHRSGKHREKSHSRHLNKC